MQRPNWSWYASITVTTYHPVDTSPIDTRVIIGRFRGAILRTLYAVALPRGEPARPSQRGKIKRLRGPYFQQLR